MKKQGWLLIGITGAFICLLLGIFAGRNWSGTYIHVQDAINTQTQTTPDNTNNYDGRMDINTANLQQLQLLPGIGEALAQRIIDFRTEHGAFTAVEDLMKVNGIGEKKFAELSRYIKIG